MIIYKNIWNAVAKSTLLYRPVMEMECGGWQGGGTSRIHHFCQVSLGHLPTCIAGTNRKRREPSPADNFHSFLLMLTIVSYLKAYGVLWLIILLGSSSHVCQFGEVVVLTSCHDLNFILLGVSHSNLRSGLVWEPGHTMWICILIWSFQILFEEFVGKP